MRLETRVPGADANPYLAMAASLAAGLYGIRHELRLEVQPTKGNEYENDQPKSKCFFEKCDYLQIYRQ